MSELVIQNAILADTLSVAASTVYNEDSSFYLNVNKVPRHVTTCLADLLSSAGITPFASAVNISQGQGTNPTVGIVIEPITTFESCSNKIEAPIYNDEPGAVKAKVSILVRGIRTSTDPTLVRDIGLRLIYILDNSARSKEFNTYMSNQTHYNFDTSIDTSVLDPNTVAGAYYRMLYERSDQLSVGEWGHIFTVEYIRNFGG